MFKIECVQYWIEKFQLSLVASSPFARHWYNSQCEKPFGKVCIANNIVDEEKLMVFPIHIYVVYVSYPFSLRWLCARTVKLFPNKINKSYKQKRCDKFTDWYGKRKLNDKYQNDTMEKAFTYIFGWSKLENEKIVLCLFSVCNNQRIAFGSLLICPVQMENTTF